MFDTSHNHVLPILSPAPAEEAERAGPAMERSAEEPSQLARVRGQQHPGCFACGLANGYGLRLEFTRRGDDVVEARFPCPAACTGYPGMVHGGVICTLLDGAMTNCLFAQGVVGVTVEMNVRFRHPMAVGRMAIVRAWPEAGGSPIHRLAAEVTQQDHIVATATARFLEKNAMQWFKD